MRASRSKSARRSLGSAGVRTRDSRAYRIENLEPRPRILIVCEGAKTEPNYFLSFRVTNDVYGEGVETLRVVEEAERRNAKEGPFDQIWCVFDRDDFPPQDFDNAIHKVQSRIEEGFRAAYSNEAFELWYLLHFEYLDAAVHRTHYIQKINTHIEQKLKNWKYKKGDTEIYSLLQTHGDEARATRWAQKLRALHGEDIPCSQRCPITTVDQLVQALREVQRQRGY